jgi:WD40 repeat protein
VRCADFVRRVGFFPDHRRFFAASLDGTVRVWSLPTSTTSLSAYSFDCGRANELVLTTPQGTQTFSPDGSLVVRFNATQAEVRRRLGDGEVLWRLPEKTRWARFTADGQRLLAANQVEVRGFEARTGGKAVPLDGSLNRADFLVGTTRIWPSADGKRLATLDDPYSISVWDTETGQRLRGPYRITRGYPHVFGPPKDHGKIAHPRLTPDGRILIFGIPSGGLLTAWEIESGKQLYKAKKYSGNLHELAISEDGLNLLVASSDTTARLFDLHSGAPLGPPLAHTGTVLNGDIAADCVRVVTREGSIARIWDARRGDLLVRLPPLAEDVEPLWFSRDGRRVILAGKERAAAWPLPSLEMPAEYVPALVRLLAGRDIDDANGLTQLDQHAFLEDPVPYRKAWLTWRGKTDDFGAQP